MFSLEFFCPFLALCNFDSYTCVLYMWLKLRAKFSVQYLYGVRTTVHLKILHLQLLVVGKKEKMRFFTLMFSAEKAGFLRLCQVKYRLSYYFQKWSQASNLRSGGGADGGGERWAGGCSSFVAL
jgi:hypothetical protein